MGEKKKKEKISVCYPQMLLVFYHDNIDHGSRTQNFRLNFSPSFGATTNIIDIFDIYIHNEYYVILKRNRISCGSFRLDDIKYIFDYEYIYSFATTLRHLVYIIFYLHMDPQHHINTYICTYTYTYNTH